jgi:hypothetical protein
MLSWLRLLRAWGCRHYDRVMFQRFLQSLPDSRRPKGAAHVHKAH